MNTVIVEIDEQGNVRIDTKGFSGKSCKDATRELEIALGIVTDEKLTADYYRAEPLQAHTNAVRS